MPLSKEVKDKLEEFVPNYVFDNPVAMAAIAVEATRVVTMNDPVDMMVALLTPITLDGKLDELEKYASDIVALMTN